MFRSLALSTRVETLLTTRTFARRWRIQRCFEAWIFHRGPCIGKCGASKDARLAQCYRRRSTHGNAALQHPQARQFQEKNGQKTRLDLATFADPKVQAVPRGGLALFAASCLHFLSLVLPYTGQESEGQGKAKSQGPGQGEGEMTTKERMTN